MYFSRKLNYSSSILQCFIPLWVLPWWSRCLDKNNSDFTSNYKASHWVLIKQDIICRVTVNNNNYYYYYYGNDSQIQNFVVELWCSRFTRQVAKFMQYCNLIFTGPYAKKHRKNRFFHSVVDWQPRSRSLRQLDMMIIAWNQKKFGISLRTLKNLK